MKKQTANKYSNVLSPLRKKFEEAGCYCYLSVDSKTTTLYITYKNILAFGNR